MRAVLIAVSLLGACASDDTNDGPATCRTAVHRFYELGCKAVDLTTGQPIDPPPESESLAKCEMEDHFACDIEWQATLECRESIPNCDDRGCSSANAAYQNCLANR